MSDVSTPQNTFTRAPIGLLLAQTALPIMAVMTMNGLLSVADAVFLGIFVGADALAAVSLMFPATMFTIALSAMIASGMSSLVARYLGGNRIDKARAAFAGAHGLALVCSAILILGFLAAGWPLALLAANGDRTLADMGYTYVAITYLFSPVLFVLSVNSDALRSEGRIGFMTAMSLLVSLSNMLFNYLLIALAGLGVAGSAFGTVLAQMLAAGIILGFRLRSATPLSLKCLVCSSLTSAWGRMLALGAPASLNYLGIALVSAAILMALRWAKAPQYDLTVAAYGIVTRLITFVFLPHLGLVLALQSIIGNNFGAGLLRRSDAVLRLGLVCSLCFCGASELILGLNAASLGFVFAKDPAIAAEVAHILPQLLALLFASGPVMVVSGYFQAIGDAGRAALLSLTKPYLFSLPLVFILAAQFGAPGIWLSGPVADLLLVLLTAALLAATARQRAMRWGLFLAPRAAPS